jgi:hypothetical protein
MTFAPVIDALALPEDACLNQRVPKKLLLEQGAPTTADKRRLQDGVEEMFWVAAIKPTNCGVPAFRDGVREYLEISVITAVLRDAAKPARVIELIHRAIPYPVVLVTALRGTVALSLAHKRWSQGEAGKVVIEEVRCTVDFDPNTPTAEEAHFLTSLTFAGLPACDLFALYQGWLDRVAALEAAQITGVFAPPDSPDRSTALHDGLEAHARLQRDLTVLRAKAAKEKQINRRVELNLEIKRLETELAKVTENVLPGHPV